jgi:microcompartment protein CcmK/EutM
MASSPGLYSCPEAFDRFAPEILAGHVENLVDTEKIDAGKEFVVTVIDGSDPAADLARSLEYGEFWREFKNDYWTMEKEYAPYDSASTFIVALKGGNPVGLMRLIMNGPAGLKTLNDVAVPNVGWGTDMLVAINEGLAARTDLPVDDRRTSTDLIADVASIAVRPDYRRYPEAHTINAAVMRAGMIATLNSGRRDFIAVMAEVPLGVYDKKFDRPVSRIAGLGKKNYLGVDSYPVYGALTDYFRRAAATNPNLSDMLLRGDGLYSVAKHVTTVPELDRITS